LNDGRRQRRPLAREQKPAGPHRIAEGLLAKGVVDIRYGLAHDRLSAGLGRPVNTNFCRG